MLDVFFDELWTCLNVQGYKRANVYNMRSMLRYHLDHSRMRVPKPREARRKGGSRVHGMSSLLCSSLILLQSAARTCCDTGGDALVLHSSTLPQPTAPSSRTIRISGPDGGLIPFIGDVVQTRVLYVVKGSRKSSADTLD